MARIIAEFNQFFDGAGKPLIDGKLRFLESATNNTDKATFKDVNLTIANTNPVLLDGEGKTEFDVFGDGVYKVILFTSDDVQIRIEDPVDGGAGTGQWDDWQPGIIYDSGFIVTGSDKKNYRSITDGNQGNDPTLSSTDWEELQLGRVWNTAVSYSIGDSVFGSSGKAFISLVNSNLGNDPETDSGANWRLDSISTAEQFNYSTDVTMPTSEVVSLNPSAQGLLVTLTTTSVGDIKRLINISAFDVLVKLTGTGFLTISPGDTAYTLRVGTDWFAVANTNETIPGSLVSFGTAEVFNSATTSILSLTRVTDTKIAIAYAVGTASGNVIIGDISSGSITFGTTNIFDATNTAHISIIRLTDSKIAIAYNDAPGAAGTAIIGDISGTVVTFGTEVIFEAGNTQDTSIERLTDTKLVIAFKDQGDGSFGKAIIGDISGTVITFGSPVTFESASTASISVTALTTSKIAITYRDVGAGGFGNAIIGTISGTVITFGTAVVIVAASVNYTVATRIADDKVAIAYQDQGNSSFGTAIIGDVTGTVVVFGTAVVFETADSRHISIDTLDADRIVIAYADNGNSDAGTAIIGAVSGTVITFGGPFVFNNAASTENSIATTSDGNFAIAYNDGGNSSFGTAITGREVTI